jgi:glycosyltransferase involved in cell wall biosynthesis
MGDRERRIAVAARVGMRNAAAGAMETRDAGTTAPPPLAGCNPLLLAGQLSDGGTERQTYLAARSLQRSGMSPGVVVWTLTGADRYQRAIEDLGIPVVTAPQGKGRLAKMRWLRRLVQQVRPEVLHAMPFYLNAAAAWAMRGLPGVAVGGLRCDYRLPAVDGWVYYRVNRRWPGILLANSEKAVREAQQDRSPFRPRHLFWVPNAIDLEVFLPRRHAAVACPLVAGVGNLRREKRWDRLLRVLARVRQRTPELDFRAEIAGEGGERPALQRLVGELGLSERVALLGLRRDVPQFLQSADVLALVSDSEGAPNAVLEGMAAGLPVLATAVGDVPRLVEDGVHGFVVPPADEELLAERLTALLRDAGLRARLGAEGRRKAEREFGLEQLGIRLREIYQQAKELAG